MKKLFLGLIVLALTACSSQTVKEEKVENKVIVKKKEVKKVYEKEVLNLAVDNSVAEKLTFTWELPQGAEEIGQIQILRKYSNDQAYKRIRIKGLKADSSSITIDEFGLMTANYKVKLITKDKRRSKGVEVEVYTKHSTVIADEFGGKKMFVYLPKGYKESDKRYPVMYMWDGQMLFTEGYGKTWEIDETLTRLAKEGLAEEMIVVGLFNAESGRRIEYFPFQIEGLWVGEGDKHAEFLAKEVVPYIDGKYRTIADRENRGIMGSSMGGLMSMYTLTAQAETFNMAGILSPWFPDNLLDYVANMPKVEGAKIWVDAGTDETSPHFGHYAINARRLVETLEEKGYENEKDFLYYEVSDGIHHEVDWAKRVHNPFMEFKGIKTPNNFDIELIDEQFVGNDKDRRYLNVLVKNDLGGFYTALDKAKYRSLDGKIDIDSKGKYEFLDENGGEVEVEYKGIIKKIFLSPIK